MGVTNIRTQQSSEALSNNYQLEDQTTTNPTTGTPKTQLQCYQWDSFGITNGMAVAFKDKEIVTCSVGEKCGVARATVTFDGQSQSYSASLGLCYNGTPETAKKMLEDLGTLNAATVTNIRTQQSSEALSNNYQLEENQISAATIAPLTTPIVTTALIFGLVILAPKE